MWQKITDFFKIESLTTRIRLAFMCLTFLLLFSGVMSLMELERVGHDTEKILLASKSNVDLAGEMLDALNKQNNAMINMAVKGEDIKLHRATCEEGIKDLSHTVGLAKEVVKQTENPHSADQLISATNRINNYSKSFINGEIIDEFTQSYIMEHGNPEDNSFRGDLFVDDVDRMVAEKAIKDKINNWYIEVYQPQYIELSHEITQYMTGVHNTLGPEVSNLSHTARRTVTPVFITLLVMIVIVLIFYFFMELYVVKPIKRINKSLGTYLAYKTPFDDSINSRDEIRALRDRIAALISKIR